MTATKEKKAPAKKKTPTKGESLAEVVELLEKIEKAEKDVEKAELAWNKQKEEAKIAKGVYQTRVDTLRDLAKTRDRWAEEAKRQPLFANQNKEKKSADKPNEAKPEAARPGDDESYKTQPLAVLKPRLSEKAWDALDATGIKTLGDMQAKMNEGGQFWPKNLGVHGRHKEDIEKAYNDFLMGK